MVESSKICQPGKCVDNNDDDGDELSKCRCDQSRGTGKIRGGRDRFTLALTVSLLSIAFAPLAIAPLSENVSPI